jgi:hypothetical protein
VKGVLRASFALVLFVSSLALVGGPAQAIDSRYDAPGNFSVQDLGGGQIELSWSAPAPKYFGPPESYSATVSSTTSSGYGNFYYESCRGADYWLYATSCRLSGLKNGVTYEAEVVVNAPIRGDKATVQFTLCCDVPAVPGAASATAGDSYALVSWDPPTNVGAAGTTFTYQVVANPGGLGCTTSEQSCRIEGLTNGVDYSFTISASNSAGQGPGGTWGTVRPLGSPSSPTGVQVFLEDKGVALVTWASPSTDGGTPITRFVAVSEPDGFVCETTGALECKIRGLSNGQVYTFRVTAFNAIGQSVASEASPPAVPRAVPSKPMKVKAKRQGTTITVSWKAPKSKGGSKIRGYVTEQENDKKKCVRRKNKTTCTFRKLAAGKTYAFAIQARNLTGLGIPARTKPITIPTKSSGSGSSGSGKGEAQFS